MERPKRRSQFAQMRWRSPTKKRRDSATATSASRLSCCCSRSCVTSEVPDPRVRRGNDSGWVGVPIGPTITTASTECAQAATSAYSLVWRSQRPTPEHGLPRVRH